MYRCRAKSCAAILADDLDGYAEAGMLAYLARDDVIEQRTAGRTDHGALGGGRAQLAARAGGAGGRAGAAGAAAVGGETGAGGCRGGPGGRGMVAREFRCRGGPLQAVAVAPVAGTAVLWRPADTARKARDVWE